MERGYSERIVMTQIINARGEFRDNFHERGNIRTSLIKSTKKVFSELLVVGFRNGKSLKDYLVGAALQKRDNVGGSESCGKVSFQVCDCIIRITIFSINASGKVFKNQIWSFNCHSEKVLYLLSCNIFDDTSYVGKTRTKFRLRFNKYESKHQSF